MSEAYNPFSLRGKTILVTGASSGIGQATAVECSKLGARLAVCARNPERLQETFTQLEGEGHSQIIAELTSPEDVANLVDQSPELDGLVLCAGKGLTLPFAFCSREKYDDIFNINFFSTVETLRLLVKKKKLAKGASVVIVASIGGRVVREDLIPCGGEILQLFDKPPVGDVSGDHDGVDFRGVIPAERLLPVVRAGQ